MTASTFNVSAPASGAMLCAHPTQRKAFAMKSHYGLRRRGMIGRALLAAIIGAAFASPPAVAQSGLRQAMTKADDLIALYDAIDHTSPVCKGYVGKVVTPTAFSALTARLSGPAPKGEYETTAQYRARLAARPAFNPTATAIVTLPVDRDYVSYEADGGMLMVRVGAFGAGRFSDDFVVQMIADDYGLIPPELKTGTFIAHNETERLIRAYVARNGFGSTAKVSDFDRRTNGLYLTSPRLFPFAKSDNTPVLVAKVPAVQAQRLKPTLRLALVIEPKAPFVFRLEQPGAAATIRNPVHYENTLTAIYADPKCALALDPTGRVLAAVNAGS